MRRTKTIYKDSKFDILQKTINLESEIAAHSNFKKNKRKSKISQQFGSLYLNELVNDIKETIINNEDSEIFNSNLETENIIEKKLNPKNKNSISKIKRRDKNSNTKKSNHKLLLSSRSNISKISKKSNNIKINHHLNSNSSSSNEKKSNHSNNIEIISENFDMEKEKNEFLTLDNDFYALKIKNFKLKDKSNDPNNMTYKSSFKRTRTGPKTVKFHILKEKNKSKFKENNNIQNIFDSKNTKENDYLFSMSGISNKNIIEVNEITQDLKKSLVLTPSSRIKTLNSIKKSYIKEDDDDELNEINELSSDKEEEDNYLDKYRDLQRKGLVYDSFDELDDDEISKYFIHPDSRLLIFIDFLLVICIFYDLIYIPLYLGINDIYCNQKSFVNFFNVFELIINFIYAFDFFLYFFVGYYDNDDILKTGIKSMFIHYFKHWFLINFLTAIPFKTLFVIFDKSCQDIHFLSSYKYSSQYYYLLTCVRLLKIFRLFKNKFLYLLNEKLDKYEIYNNYLGLFQGLTIFCLTVHVVSCIFIFLGKNDIESWINKFNFQEFNFANLYFIGIYYLITTVTTVGYGDLTCSTPNEKIFGIIIEIVGIVAYSYILTAISNYVKSKSDQREEYFKKYQVLEDMKITYDDFSDDLFERIDRYIKTKHRSEDEEKNLIQELPITLKNDLVYNMYEHIIRNFVFFKKFDNKDFIVSVIFAFNPISAIKNDVLIKDGEFVEDIIFIKSGKITLEYPIKIMNDKEEKNNNNRNSTLNYMTFTKLNTVFNHQKTNTMKENFFFNHLTTNNTNLNNNFFEEEENYEIQKLKILDIQKNEHFGDILMFSNERSPLCATVKSRKADLFYLNKKDAIEISKNYPIIWQKIQQISSFNMKQIRRLIIRLEKIFYKKNGLKNIKNSNLSNEDELKSIPSISDENELYNHLKNVSKKISNKSMKSKDEISGLKTIKEVTQVEDSEEISSDSEKNNKTQYSQFKTKKVEIGNESDSSQYLDNNTNNDNNDNDTIKEIKNNNNNILNNIEFSEVYSLDDVKNNNNFNNKKFTPFKPEEINIEIYPNENFMKYDEYYVKEDLFYDDSSKKNLIIKKEKEDNNFSNISICSTEISFSINRSYDNTNELSDFKYIKIPKLRKRIKNVLKDFEESSLIEYSKFKTNKIKAKSNLTINTYYDKNEEENKLPKSSFDFFKKKKVKEVTFKSVDNEINVNNLRKLSLKKEKNNFLDIVYNENAQKNEDILSDYNDQNSFTSVFKKFIENDNSKEFNQEKEELNLKIQQLNTTQKKQFQLSFNNHINNIK